MAALEGVDCIINDIEIEIAKQNQQIDKLTFFDIDEIDVNELNNHHIDYYFKSRYKPIVIRGGGLHFAACKYWKTDFKYLLKKCGNNLVYVRTETNCENYRKGQKYKIDKMKLSKYLNQILNNDPKSLSSYMAVTNIRYKLKEIINDVPLTNFELSQTHKGDHVRIFQLFKDSPFKFKLHRYSIINIIT